MNCKPGDLAVVIGRHNNGHIVEVLELYDAEGWLCRCKVDLHGSLEGRSAVLKAGDTGYCPDKYLRPISGGQLTDETEEHDECPIIA